MKRPVFYEPRGEGREAPIAQRLRRLAELRAGTKKPE
jgi:hypothetical protein